MPACKIHCAGAIVRWLVNSVGVGAGGLNFRCKESGAFFSASSTRSDEYLWQSFVNSVGSPSTPRGRTAYKDRNPVCNGTI